MAAIRKSPPKRRGQDKRIATKKKPMHLRYAAAVLGSVSVATLACALGASPAMAQVSGTSPLVGVTATQGADGDINTITITDKTNGSTLDASTLTDTTTTDFKGNGVTINGGTATGADDDVLTVTGTTNVLNDGSVTKAAITGTTDSATDTLTLTNASELNSVKIVSSSTAQSGLTLTGDETVNKLNNAIMEMATVKNVGIGASAADVGAATNTLVMTGSNTINASKLNNVEVTDGTPTLAAGLKLVGNANVLDAAVITNSNIADSQIDNLTASNATINTVAINGTTNDQTIDKLHVTGDNTMKTSLIDNVIVQATVGSGLIVGPRTGGSSAADNAIAVGVNANAAGASSVSIGQNSHAEGLNAVAIGKGAGATEEGAVAVGNASASALHSSALGDGATASGQRASALGNNSQATEADATALGSNAIATATNATAVGTGAAASASDATALGAGAAASAADALAVGDATAGAEKALAFGKDANASAEGSIALGAGSTANGVGALALGRSATASADDGVAVGRGSKSSGVGAIALGAGVNAAKDGAIGIGQNAGGTSGGGQDSVVIGANAGRVTAGDGAVLLGADTGGQTNAVALGINAQALSASSVAIGEGSGVGAQGQGGVAIGRSATASGPNSIALGAGSVAGEANTVSVGDGTLQRRIVNVSAGTADNDAVNYQQLKVERTRIDGLEPDVQNLNANALQYTGGTFNAIRNGVAQRITGVATPVNTTDAANKGYVDTKVDDFAANYGDALVYKQGKDYYGQSQKLFDASRAVSGNGNPQPRKIIGVQAGAVEKDSNEVVVGSQLYQTNEDVATLQTQIGNSLSYDASATGGAAYSAYRDVGGSKQETRITGVADPLEQSDAVNLRKFTDLENAVGQLTAGEAIVGTVVGTDSFGRGVSASTTGNYSTAFGSYAQTFADRASAFGSHATVGVGADDSVAIGAFSVADQAKTVSVGDGNTGLYRRITNVAESQGDHDAVTRGEVRGWLSQAGVDIDNGGGANGGGGDGGGGGGGGVPGGVVVGTATGTESVAIGGRSVASGDYSTAYGYNAQALGGGGTAIGHSAYAAGPGDIAIGHNARVEADNSIAQGTNALVTASAPRAVAMGADSIVSAPNSVALGAGSVADQPNTVSVGAPGAERRITNVAPGIAPNDAVNVGQLYTYTQSMLKETRRGIAATAALSPVMTPSAPGKTTVSASAGFYRSEFGFGVSLAHRLDTNMPVMIHAGYANGGGKEHVGRVGVAVEF
ncbi:YadA family autotransporter adhesin [Chelatococcus sp. GCM10030263]|uniref:YadA family autotransporter adhesin n=1 Tax=Chelatococcus sp. GCM10030263 TaxID=3273387 RepID=UPI00360C87DB